MNSTERTCEPFLDWYGIWPGATAYEKDGRAWVSEEPQGVELSVQQAEKSGSVLVVDRPWEGSDLFACNVLYEDGRYRMWYRTFGRTGSLLCYAESEDAFRWEKPELGIHERNGSKANNVVDPQGIGATVFRDPHAPSEERYKMVDMVGASKYQGRVIRGGEIEQAISDLTGKGLTVAEAWATLKVEGHVVGAVSPDGLHWTRIEEPLFKKFCDTQNVAFYDEALGRYVGYWRTVVGGRRATARSETDDFRHWPLPDTVLAPDTQEPPTYDYYTNAYTRYPGRAGGFHLMFPAVYYRTTDVVDVRLAVSRDGINWTWPERTPIIPLGPEGSGQSGGIYAAPGIITLRDGRWAVLCSSADARHNEGYTYEVTDEPTRPFWAMWKRDRLVALEAPQEGQVTLFSSGGNSKGRIFSGESMLLNYQTTRNGWIQVELIEPNLWPPSHLEPLKGYSFEECEPLRGDSPEAEVKWSGSADLSALKGRALCIRIRMCQAKLFTISA